MENQQKKIFANCSQTVRKHCEFRNVLATSFALRNPIPQYTVALRNLPLTKPMRNFALPKFAMSSQTNFAMPNSISQCENFAMPNSQCEFRNANFAMPNSISQCQFQIRNANTLFICLTIKAIAKFRIAKFTNHFAKIRKPISHCQIHCLCEIHICRPCHPL